MKSINLLIFMENLEKLNEKISNCKKCELHKTRTNAVPGEGPEDADVMLIGEGPGYNEDQKGRPFVGKAGEILDDLLERAGLEREDVFIGNVIKCRPPENRDPNEEEIKKCSPYLKKQIQHIRPKIIITLGRFASKLLLGRSVKVSKEHGKLLNCEYAGLECKLFVSYHPAATLYGPAAGDKLEKDFEKLKDILDELKDFKPIQQTTF